jgi:hypothetical protein
VKLIYRGDGDYDLECDRAVIELSYKAGTWTFWNVRVGKDRFGGTQIVGPGTFLDWLDARRKDLQRAREAA